MPDKINVGRKHSGGVFDGLFGNPLKEDVVSDYYRRYIKFIVNKHPTEARWLKQKLAEGAVLYCPGCGIGSPTCHARVLEEVLSHLQ